MMVTIGAVMAVMMEVRGTRSAEMMIATDAKSSVMVAAMVVQMITVAPNGRYDCPGQGCGVPQGGHGLGRTPSPYQDVDCQIFKKHGHPANECWWRCADKDDRDDDDSRTEEKGAYGVDTNWYMDNGATDHITIELNKLHTRDTYRGRDQVQNAGGKGMDIQHIGHSLLHTPHISLHLHNILLVPSASNNLLSTHKIALDNNAFVEFHPFFFLSRTRPRRK
jgi:hypothetical protein